STLDVSVEPCADAGSLLERLDHGAAAILLPEAARLKPAMLAGLKASLSIQPDWSELPVIALTPPDLSPFLEEELRALPGLVLLEQPVTPRTLQSCLRAALRARQRQYRLRDRLDEARRSNAQLHASVQAKDEFLAVLAHELRNPLGAITAAVRVLASSAERPEQFALARDVIARQSDQMRRLLEDLLDVTAVTSRPRSLQRKPQSMRPLIGAAIAAVRTALDNKGHTLQVEQPATSAQVNVDGARISQVLVNLLTNAIKYTPDGGRIALSAEADRAGFVVRIRDNGIGIAPDALESIFGMFAQLAEARERANGGFGIGLALARGIAELHDGSLIARSDGPGRGSEFALTLPIAGFATDDDARDRTSAPDAAIVPDAATATAASPGRRILLVDDNEDSVQALCAVLELNRHQVHCASSGVDALRIAVEQSPEIAILDIGMPDMDGYELARRLRGQVAGGLVLIALTGWSQPNDRRRALDAGFDHHLTKPVDFDQLENLMRDVTSR
ncbi:MAG TPA: ATP-binding protein, partial [Steroidobacteraceae bacterium]|nr:ATP-binding protein [Steroidobacteraceae bacterium]